MKDTIEPVVGEEFAIPLSWIEMFVCKESYKRIRMLLDDAWLITIEREYPALQLIVDDIRRNFDKIGRLTGLNGQKRLESKT